MSVRLLLTVLFPSFGLFMLASCSGGNHHFTVIGDLSNLPAPQTVLLQELSIDDKIIAVDSGRTDDKGHFELSGEAARPGLYQLIIGRQQFILLSLNSGNVHVAADWRQVKDYTVEGSPSSASLRSFVRIVSESMNDLRTLEVVKDSMRAQGKDSMVATAVSDERDVSTNLTQFIEHYADTTIYLPNALFAVRTLNPAVEAPYLETFSGTIARRFPNEPEAKEFGDKFRKMVAMQAQQSRQASAANQSLGTMAPDIALPTPEGNVIKLSSMRGKYVLVDFWASWCGPCRMENPNVVAAFNKFKNKGFTVFGVSLDENKDKWVEAVKNDGLAWTQVSDLKRWESIVVRDYGLESIPSNVLLDKEGKIIGKDLRGAALDAKLAEVLK